MSVTIQVRVTLELHELADMLLSAIGYQETLQDALTRLESLKPNETRTLVREELAYSGYGRSSSGWIESLPDSDITRAVNAAMDAVARAFIDKR